MTERGFRILVWSAQTLFGAWFLVHGLNYWLEFFPQPHGGTGPAFEFLNILIQTGLFTLIKMIEVIAGVLLLLHRLVPLAIIASLPIDLVIVYHNWVFYHDRFHAITGTLVLLVFVVMALGYMKQFRALLTYDAGAPSLAELAAWWRRPFSGN
jgi:uncharacterized membrane protein YphA (DoxX/SURF4 family)